MTDNLAKNILKVSILILLLHVSPAVWAVSPAYHIEVSIKNFQDKTIYLGYPYGDKKYLADTAEISADGKFVFEGTKPLDGGLYFIYSPNNLYFDLIVAEPSFGLQTDTLDYINHMKVDGSMENKVFFDFQRFMQTHQKKASKISEKIKQEKDSNEKAKLESDLKKLDEEVRQYRMNLIQENSNLFVSKFIKSTINPEVPDAPKGADGKPLDKNFGYKYYKQHFFDNIDFSDARMLRTPNFYPKILDYLDKMTLKTPDSIIVSAHQIIEKAKQNKDVFRYCVVNITYKYETSKIMGMDAVFVDLADNYHLSGDAFWADSTLTAKISDRVARIKPNLIGNLAPKMVLLDTTLNPISLYSIKADYIILFFYDPDCGHCKKKTPVLRDIYEMKLKQMGVQVVAADIKKDIDKWKKFVRERKLSWINLSDPYVRSNFRYEYNIESTPTIYVLDRHKKIIAKKLDVDQLYEFIQKQKEIEKNQSTNG